MRAGPTAASSSPNPRPWSSSREGIVDRLPHRPGLEAHLGQLVGGWVGYLARTARPPLPPMRNRVGLRAPAHLSGCGKGAFAAMPDDDVVALVLATFHYEGRPRPDPVELAADLTAIRRDGYVVNTGFQPPRRSVAVAVRVSGVAVGGIPLASPSDGFDHASALAASPRVRDAAEAVSFRLTGPVAWAG